MPGNLLWCVSVCVCVSGMCVSLCVLCFHAHVSGEWGRGEKREEGRITENEAVHLGR